MQCELACTFTSGRLDLLLSLLLLLDLWPLPRLLRLLGGGEDVFTGSVDDIFDGDRLAIDRHGGLAKLFADLFDGVDRGLGLCVVVRFGLGLALGRRDLLFGGGDALFRDAVLRRVSAARARS